MHTERQITFVHANTKGTVAAALFSLHIQAVLHAEMWNEVKPVNVLALAKMVKEP